MQLRVYRSQRPLECGLALSNGNIGFGAIEIEVDDKGLVGHVTDSTDDLAQFVRARVGATKTTKGAGVGNRCGKPGSGCTCHGRLNNWMLDLEQIDERLPWPRHGFANASGLPRQKRELSDNLCARHHAMGLAGLI